MTLDSESVRRAEQRPASVHIPQTPVLTQAHPQRCVRGPWREQRQEMNVDGRKKEKAFVSFTFHSTPSESMRQIKFLNLFLGKGNRKNKNKLSINTDCVSISFSQNKSNTSKILTKHNCHFQLFPLNGVTHISCNSPQILSNEI